jgi:hypothetical protein
MVEEFDKNGVFKRVDSLESRFVNFEGRLTGYESRLTQYEGTNQRRHEDNLKELRLTNEHLQKQDAAAKEFQTSLQDKLDDISTKIAISDGIKQGKIEEAAKRQNRMLLIIAILGVAASLFSGSNFLSHLH